MKHALMTSAAILIALAVFPSGVRASTPDELNRACEVLILSQAEDTDFLITKARQVIEQCQDEAPSFSAECQNFIVEFGVCLEKNPVARSFGACAIIANRLVLNCPDVLAWSTDEDNWSTLKD